MKNQYCTLYTVRYMLYIMEKQIGTRKALYEDTVMLI